MSQAMTQKSKIIWLTWKDRKHPQAGGAEVVCHELTQRLAKDGHEVTILTCGYPGAPEQETMDGVKVIRVGSNRYLHPLQARAYYRKHLRGQHDVVIEEIQGCAPYFAAALEKDNPNTKSFLFYHQLARLNWLYEVPKPFSYVGYLTLAPAATRLASLSKTPVITVSESTRQVLAPYGFHPSRTHIISEGLQNERLASLKDVKRIKKYAKPTVLSLGAMRAMKRTLDQITAFELAKQSIPDLQLKVAGSSSGAYGQKVLAAIKASPFAKDIEYLGKVSLEVKTELMQKSHLIAVTSVEEGWGLIVTEANSLGTPAVVYNVSGLRDSVRDGNKQDQAQTGVITAANPAALAKGIVGLLENKKQYERIRTAAWEWSGEITFDKSVADLKQIIGLEK